MLVLVSEFVKDKEIENVIIFVEIIDEFVEYKEIELVMFVGNLEFEESFLLKFVVGLVVFSEEQDQDVFIMEVVQKFLELFSLIKEMIFSVGEMF